MSLRYLRVEPEDVVEPLDAGLHEREAALAAAEHEWLELELKREEIEGA